MIIYINSIKDHIIHHKNTSKTFEYAGVTLQLLKFTTFTDSVEFLVHIIRHVRLDIDSTHTLALQKSTPLNDKS